MGQSGCTGKGRKASDKGCRTVVVKYRTASGGHETVRMTLPIVEAEDLHSELARKKTQDRTAVVKRFKGHQFTGAQIQKVELI